MSKPWWQYLAISEESEYVLPEEERFIAFAIMALGLLIITPQLLYNILKISSQKGLTGSKIGKNYRLMFLGVYFTYLNSFFLRLSIYLTDGEFSVMGQEKGVLFVFGILLFCIGTIHVAFDIINFRRRTIKIIYFIYYSFLSIGLSIIVMQFMIIFGNDDIIEITILVTALAAVLGSIFLLIFIFSFLFEMTNDPSKIEKLRLRLLSIGLALMILELLAIGLTSMAKRIENPDLFINTTAYVLPIVYLIAQPIMYLVFIWAIFTPNWLLIRAKVIQPSFKEFLNSKKR